MYIKFTRRLFIPFGICLITLLNSQQAMSMANNSQDEVQPNDATSNMEPNTTATAPEQQLVRPADTATKSEPSVESNTGSENKEPIKQQTTTVELNENETKNDDNVNTASASHPEPTPPVDEKKPQEKTSDPESNSSPSNESIVNQSQQKPEEIIAGIAPRKSEQETDITANKKQIDRKIKPSELETQISQIATQRLVYNVDYAGQNAGDLEIRINKNNNILEIDSISHLSSLARLFLDSYTVKTRFEINANEIFLLSGETRHETDNEIQHGFTIHHQAKTVDFYSGDKIQFTHQDEFEADSFPLKLITSDLNSLQEKTVLAISGKRITPYTYTDIKTEEITINGKPFNTIRVTRTKVNDLERTVTFWLNLQNSNLPVKIESQNDGVKTVLTIKS